ncbi:VCBS repeat-containing protein [Vitiosangium sp. GDMCC 1.1324]|uniref:FG-GAP repeat domain-containing protein n=1 Tax=Vitiosangium sp. (strain GDMCC 1.1324) TaxID=2138576 RepID=UPI00130DD83F|nr:VCBS repeat-containing protein [Vitiosangium sp. GDMCC 1.1324]
MTPNFKLEMELVITWYVPDSGSDGGTSDGGTSDGGTSDGGVPSRPNGGSDFNGDGRADLFLYYSETGNTEIRYGSSGDGALSFSPASQVAWGTGLELVPGDYNGDKRSDLFVYEAGTGHVEIRYGNASSGALTLSSASQDTWNTGHQLVPGDYNGDGKTDLFLYNPMTGGAEIRYGSSSGGALTFSAASQVSWSTGLKFTPGDYNGDGKTDLFLLNPATGANEIRFGNSSGGALSFAPATQSGGSSGPILGFKLVPGDYNGDGKTDLFVYRADTGSAHLAYSNGQTLSSSPASLSAWNTGLQLVPGDYNGDGKTDLFVYNLASGSSEIRYGNSSGGALTFSAASQASWVTGLKLVPGDYNGDGKTDLFLYNTVTGGSEIRYGNSSGGALTFSAASQASWVTGLKLLSGFGPLYWGKAMGAELLARGPDFNGDGTTDTAVFTAANAWLANLSTGSGFVARNWSGGAAGSWGGIPLTGDFNGDGLTDSAIFTATNAWLVNLSTGTGFVAQDWSSGAAGSWGEIPLTGDFNGDGLTDTAVFTAANAWLVNLSTGSGFVALNWSSGAAGSWGEIPLTGDFNGDGKTDTAVFTAANTWLVNLSTGTGFVAQNWSSGAAGSWGEIPLTGDFNGDGKTDTAVFTAANTWLVNLSTGTGFVARNWSSGAAGSWGEIPLTGDFNGDGKTDTAVFTAANTWLVNLSTGTGFVAQNWSGGAAGSWGEIPLNAPQHLIHSYVIKGQWYP